MESTPGNNNNNSNNNNSGHITQQQNSNKMKNAEFENDDNDMNNGNKSDNCEIIKGETAATTTVKYKNVTKGGNYK